MPWPVAVPSFSAPFVLKQSRSSSTLTVPETGPYFCVSSACIVVPVSATSPNASSSTPPPTQTPASAQI